MLPYLKAVPKSFKSSSSFSHSHLHLMCLLWGFRTDAFETFHQNLMFILASETAIEALRLTALTNRHVASHRQLINWDFIFMQFAFYTAKNDIKKLFTMFFAAAEFAEFYAQKKDASE